MLIRTLLFLFIAINLNIYSQVVIKDEIQLGSKDLSLHPGTLIFNMPEQRGRVYAEMWYHNIGLRKKHPSQVFAGFEIVFTDLTGDYVYFVCGNGPSCEICWDNYIQDYSTTPGAGTITGSLSKCVNGNPQLVPLIYESFVDDNKLKYRIIHSETSNLIGNIWFEPWACGQVNNLCIQPFTPPELNIFHIPDAERCNDTVDVAGVFRGLYWELREGEEFVLTECQDQMTGKVKFKYATNFSQEIDLPYNLEICPDNVAQYNPTRIDNLQEFEAVYLDNISTTDPSEACQLRGSIIRQQGINANGEQTGTQMFFQDGIWLTAITLAHEEQHKTDYEKELKDPDAINIFYNYYNDYSIPCSTYLADPENAKLIAENSFMAKLLQFSDKAKNEYDNKLNEVELHGRREVQASAIPYFDRLDEFIVDKFGKTVYEQIKNTCK